MTKKRSSRSPKTRNQRKPSVIRFPADRSLGNLAVLDTADDSYSWLTWSNGWKYIGEARGEIVIPDEARIGFQPSRDFCDEDAIHLRKMPWLYRLAFGAGVFEMVRQNPITDDGFAHIAELTELKCLTLDVSGLSDVGLRPLEYLSGLNHADFGAGFGPHGKGMTDTKMAHVATLTELRTLCLDHTSVTDRSLVNVERLDDLIRLRLGNTFLNGDGFAHLHALRHLEELDVWGTQVNDKTLELLAPISSLRELNLTGTKVTDAGLIHLRPLQNLQGLDLQGMAITGHGLRALDALTDLRHLNLGKIGITDRQLDDLPTLPYLTNISMSWANITDEGLLSLRRFPNLRYLYLKDTELNGYAIDMMREHFPGIDIYQSLP